MHLLDFYPSQGSYLPGEEVTFLVELETSTIQEVTLRVSIRHLTEEAIFITQSLQPVPGEHLIHLKWMPVAKPAGYSARLDVYSVSSADDAETLSATTAFDVLSHWTDFPRYGFLSDFSASRPDPETTLKKLARFHINGLQFYDWQYRHDQLLAPTDEYLDPLGREMSLASVRSLVEAAHRHGMAAMPYLAIYAASVEFWRAHSDWALYDEAGQPIPFGEDFLGLMDPSKDRPWSGHLLAECAQALQSIPFDALHIDQYGDPKRAWDSQGQPVDLPQAFVDFLRDASNQHSGKTILFNAVGNWPIESLAESAADFMYIEIWPPEVEYLQLAKIVLNAVHLAHGKPVAIALYLPADHPANNLLADAVIIACGGTRIELGEEARLLSDPYFPRHQQISPDLYAELRRLSDFLIRDGEWLRPYTLSETKKNAWAEGELNPGFVSSDASLLTIARPHAQSVVLHFVNFNGLDPHQRWDEAHELPTPSRNLSVSVRCPRQPARVLWDSPENGEGPQSLAFESFDNGIKFQIPHIQFIGLVIIHD